MTTVSVVIPVHNRRALVLPTIASVLAQTLAPLEVLVVDDGSTDGTPDAIAEMFGEQVRLIRVPQNAGRSVARNTGWAQARGSLVAFLDSDDVWEPEKLARQVPAFDDPSVVLVHGTVGHIDVDGRPLARVSADVARAYAAAAARGYDYAGITVTWTRMYPSAVVVRRDALSRTAGFDPLLHQFEDWDLLWRLAAMGRVVTITEVLTQVRLHSGNTRATWAEEAVPWLVLCHKHLAAPPASLPFAVRRRATQNLYFNVALGEYWRRRRWASRWWMWRALMMNPLRIKHAASVVLGAPLVHAFLPAWLAEGVVRLTGVDPYEQKPWEGVPVPTP